MIIIGGKATLDAKIQSDVLTELGLNAGMTLDSGNRIEYLTLPYNPKLPRLR